MPYIGNKTADTTLVEDNSISTAKIVNDAVTVDKTNLISTSSVPSLEAKGDGSSVAGKVTLNCHANSHGVTLQSPDHSSSQSWTLKLPDNSPTADKFLKVKSITGSGSTATGQLEFASAGLSNWSENSGNLLPSNASYGVYLGVNSATASNLLKDYEEGTFTPSWSSQSGTTSVASSNYGYYRKIGTSCTVHFGAVLSTSGAGGYYQVSNLPFQADVVGGRCIGVGWEFAHTNSLQQVDVGDNSTVARMRKYDGSLTANAYLSATLTYQTD